MIITPQDLRILGKPLVQSTLYVSGCDQSALRCVNPKLYGHRSVCAPHPCSQKASPSSLSTGDTSSNPTSTPGSLCLPSHLWNWFCPTNISVFHHLRIVFFFTVRMQNCDLYLKSVSQKLLSVLGKFPKQDKQV